MKTSAQQLLSALLLPLSVLAAPTGSIEARACSDVTVIFARGTTETGTLGTVVGPPFLAALKSALGSSSVTMNGVDYPADVPGFLQGGDPAGSQTMATMVTSTLSSCPDTKLVISGYSQGGQLVHNAAKLLPAETTAKISSAVIFGDPDNGDPVQGVSADRTDIICHAGDNICQGGSLILLAHLTYGMDTTAAAAFVKKAAGL
ncbi:BccutA [Botrytis cinerea B05.10]|uniref:Cutinase n=4 Tax=Botryotinia fuckeliana TaxID=40559 RepID=CUTI_BOTFU|nr:BccutA [Botrytis cinerea B05.10]Q00298.1 RecName: Full=Cutinase; AltName: Full=Cutin hydrolase; Flags: Precursor [Botrytis cinerea]EMR87660.1 putative cutinase precursor protein [Botrytis cinerea BcDW1]CCD47236.1 cutA, cutinase A [Botrytis cinerea T4]ATZ57773.1 BccutA [Botrytis cinerea B05.10]CAA93255.1 cutinase [Botrytis cinerea]